MTNSYNDPWRNLSRDLHKAVASALTWTASNNKEREIVDSKTYAVKFENVVSLASRSGIPDTLLSPIRQYLNGIGYDTGRSYNEQNTDRVKEQHCYVAMYLLHGT